MFPDGIYRLYRQYPQQDGSVQQRLVARFIIKDTVVHHLEDHDDLLSDVLPEGPMDGYHLRRLLSMSHSGYWRLVNEEELGQGHHEDLTEEHNLGPAPFKPPEE